MAKPSHVQHGTWCRRCSSERRRGTIEQMQVLAAKRGGRCLSPVYVDSQTKLTWQCAKCHIWNAAPAHVRHSSWCPQCHGNVKLTIQDMHRLAEIRGGKCLSDTYVNSQSKLLWECREGHQWMAAPSSIQQRTWCLKCSGSAKSTIQEMQRLAKSIGGRCLSDTYVNRKTHLLWECREGHRWKAMPNHVKNGHWCPVCAGLSKPSMDRIQRLAQERGGKCLAHNYVNSQTDLRWECIEGHQWKASWNAIQGGGWCPTCSSRLGERICREYFGQLLGDSFPKVRPKWLVNKAGNRMELDGYSATLGIAFEHQGEQHFSTKTHFARTGSALSRRKEDDDLKSQLCAQRGITLVSVPEIPRLLPLDHVRAFIKEQLGIRGVHLPPDIDTRNVDINRAYRTPGSRETLKELRRIAAGHGGRCLSDTYAGSQSNLLWHCAQGHKWEAPPDRIKQGAWCLRCAGKAKKTIEEMQETAAARGGKCLSDGYVNGSTHLLWQCKEGHQWKARPNDVVNKGRWCPECAASFRGRSRRLGLPAMQSLAASQGGRCLSDEYVNNGTKLLWQCKEGHQWKARPSSVKNGHWCPFCAWSKEGHSKRLGLPAMQSLAASQGGRCLSDEYINSRTHLLWQCKEGHQWKARPVNITRGYWCPICYNERRRQLQRKAR